MTELEFTELQLCADNILLAGNPTPTKEHVSAVNLSMQEINHLVNKTRRKCAKIIKRLKSIASPLVHKTKEICKQVLHIGRSNSRTSSHRKTLKKEPGSSKSSDSDGPGDRSTHCPFQPVYNLTFILFSIFLLQPCLFAVTSAEEMAK